MFLSFIEDIPIINSLKSRCSEDNDESSTTAKRLLKLIGNVVFIGRLAGITDIYSEVRKFCTSVQKMNLFLWERFQHTESLISKLDEMIEKVEDQNDENFIKILPVLAL